MPHISIGDETTLLETILRAVMSHHSIGPELPGHTSGGQITGPKLNATLFDQLHEYDAPNIFSR